MLASSALISAATRDAILAAGREALEPYVNGRGENPPRGLRWAGLSFWLMERKDGTAMGHSIR